MKVVAIIQRWGKDSKDRSVLGHKAADIFEIKHGPIEPCCDEMRDALDHGFVGFGEKDTTLNEDDSVNIYACRPYPEGAVWDAMPIYCCPWCGESIELEEREGPTVAEEEAARLPRELAAAEARVAELRRRVDGETRP